MNDQINMTDLNDPAELECFRLLLGADLGACPACKGRLIQWLDGQGRLALVH